MKNQELRNSDSLFNFLNYFPLILATVSFGIGTAIMVLYFISNDQSYYTEIGFYYLLLALLINGTAFLGLLLGSYFYKQQQLELLKKAFILLINIPISLLYLILFITLSK